MQNDSAKNTSAIRLTRYVSGKDKVNFYKNCVALFVKEWGKVISNILLNEFIKIIALTKNAQRSALSESNDAV